MDYVEVYDDAAGEWRWRRKAPNHEIVATSGEAYKDKHYAFDRAHDLNPGLKVTVVSRETDAE